MSCNGPGRKCQGLGVILGQPDTEVVQMSARRQEHCPECGGFLSEDGGCTRCEEGRGMVTYQSVSAAPGPEHCPECGGFLSSNGLCSRCSQASRAAQAPHEYAPVAVDVGGKMYWVNHLDQSELDGDAFDALLSDAAENGGFYGLQSKGAPSDGFYFTDEAASAAFTHRLGALDEDKGEPSEPAPSAPSRPAHKGEANTATTVLGDLEPPAPVAPNEMPDWLYGLIPERKDDFMLTGAQERILTTMKTSLGARWRTMKKQHDKTGEWPSGMMGRAFGFYGPPGTGKNRGLKELAAHLGVPYAEVDVGADTSIQSLIGEVVLDHGTSKAKLGPVGRILTEGGVVAINEIVSADSEMQTVLHQVAQDGIMRIPGPEGSEHTYKVHPNSVLGVTWNPGGGRADRPTPALTERLLTMPVPLPSEKEEAMILASSLRSDLGLDVPPSEVMDDIKFGRHLRELAAEGVLAHEPSPRMLRHFAATRILTGNPMIALQTVLIAADQGPELEGARQEMELYLGRLWTTNL